MIRSLVGVLAVVLVGCGGARSGAAPVGGTPAATVRVGGTCDESAYTPKQGAHYVHPSQNFDAPDAAGAPGKDDIQHLLLYDNAIVVSYPSHASAAIQKLLADWASRQTAAVVVPDASSTAPALEAFIATAELHCDGVDLEQLSAFAAKRGTGAVAEHPDEG